MGGGRPDLRWFEPLVEELRISRKVLTERRGQRYP
jgi:hypothetical protein